MRCRIAAALVECSCAQDRDQDCSKTPDMECLIKESKEKT